MAINFPASPSINDTFTAGSITYKWDGAKWIGLGVTPADRLVEGSNSLEITAGNDLVWTGNRVGFGTTGTPGAPLHITSADDILLRLESTDRFSHIDLVDNTTTTRITTDGDTGTLRLRADKDGAASGTAITFEVDGAEKARFNSSGVLDIDKASAPGLVVGGNGGGGDYHLELGQIGQNGSAGINSTGTSAALKFQLNGGDIARFDADGRLLIGNSTATITEAKIEAYADNTGNADVLCLYNKDTATGNTANILFAPSNSVAGARIICEAMEDFSTSVNRTADLSFVTRKDGTLNEALRLTGDRKLRAATAYADGTDTSGINDAKAYFDFNPTLTTWGSTGNKDKYFDPALVVRTPIRDSINNPAIVIADNGGQASGRNSLVFFNSEFDNNAGFIKARLYTQVGPAYGSPAFFIDVADSSQNIQNRFSIDSSGNFSGSSSSNISDARLKENIQTIENPIDKIKGLTGRTFTWTDDSTRNDGRTHYGFVAQEVDAVVSDLVKHDSGLTWFDADDNIVGEFDENVADSSKTVHEQGVIPILVEALKEALDKIDTLEARLEAGGL